MGDALPGTDRAFAAGRSYGGAGDDFLLVLNPQGSHIVYSAYLGGSGYEGHVCDTNDHTALAVDDAGRAYIVGITASTGDALAATGKPFPTKQGSFQPDPGTAKAGSADQGSCQFNAAVEQTYNSFLVKIDPNKTGDESLEYSTFLWPGTLAGGVAVSGNGDHVYVTGATYGGVETTQGSYQPADPTADPTHAPHVVAFLSEFNPILAASPKDQLPYSTYLSGTPGALFTGAGTPFAGAGFDVAVDPMGNAYVTGWGGPPASPGSLTATGVAESTGGLFVAKLAPSGAGLSDLLYSVHFGISRNDESSRPVAVALDAACNAYVSGTYDGGLQGGAPFVNVFPEKNPIATPYGGGKPTVSDGHIYYNGFVMALNSAGSDLLYSHGPSLAPMVRTGPAFGEINGLAIDPVSGSATVVGIVDRGISTTVAPHEAFAALSPTYSDSIFHIYASFIARINQDSPPTGSCPPPVKPLALTVPPIPAVKLPDIQIPNGPPPPNNPPPAPPAPNNPPAPPVQPPAPPPSAPLAAPPAPVSVPAQAPPPVSVPAPAPAPVPAPAIAVANQVQGQAVSQIQVQAVVQAQAALQTADQPQAARAFMQEHERRTQPGREPVSVKGAKSWLATSRSIGSARAPFLLGGMWIVIGGLMMLTRRRSPVTTPVDCHHSATSNRPKSRSTGSERRRRG